MHIKKKTFILLSYFILTFIVGISIAYGITKGITFVINNVKPEIVILDPTLAFKDKPSLGGPALEFDNEEANLLLEGEAEKGRGYVLKGNGKFPSTYSKSLLVADIETGEVIASKNAYQAFPIASLTKLMTALVAEELYKVDEVVTVSANAIKTYGAQGRLKKGDEYTIEQMLYPLLLESSNDAAEVLAEYGGRIEFLSTMNTKAQSLGLIHTYFDDPSGLSEKNTSAAYDLFLLSKYIHEFRRYIFDITELKKFSLGRVTWYSNSRFRNDSYYVGGKNGYTDEALKTQIALFELPLEGENGLRTIAIILLQSSNTEADARNIIKFLNRYVYYE